MTEIERAELAERARQLSGLKERLAESLPPAVKKSLKELPPEERRAVIRDHVLLEARELARRVRGALPPEGQRALDELGRDERRRLLAELRAKTRAEGGLAAIQHLGGELGLAPAEIERLKGLALEARLDALLALERRLVRRGVAEKGLPPGVSRETWDELERLPDRPFFQSWRALAPRAPSPWHELDRLSRPGLDDLERLRELPALARRAALAELVRERCLAYAERHALLSPDELEALRAKRGREFAEALRAAIRERAPRRGASPRPSGPF